MRSGKTLYQSRVAERIWEDEHQFSVLDSSQKKKANKKTGTNSFLLWDSIKSVSK